MLIGGNEIKENGVRISKDGMVRFAPKISYKLEQLTPEHLSKNGFVIASYGEEGAEKLGEIASQFKYNPYLWHILIVEGESDLRISALDGSEGSLHVYGGFGGDEDSHSFGVLK